MKTDMSGLARGCCYLTLAIVPLIWTRQSTAQSYLDPCWGPASARTINFGTVNVLASLPIGGVITQSNGAFVNGNATAPNRMCLVKGADVSLFTTPYNAGEKIYNTNIPGVGIQIAPLYQTGWTTQSVVAPFADTLLTPAWNGTVFGPATYGVRLIKTASNVGSGALSTGLASTFRSANGTVMYTLNITGGTIVASNPTCDLSVGDVNRDVQLDPFQLKDVPATNGKFGLKNFTITANCKDAKTASFTLSGPPSTVDGRLFASTGTALGLGLHVGTPYGDVPANGTSEQRTFSVDASSGVAQLPLEVGYSRSAAAVTIGTFLGKVTVTLGYN